MSCKNVLIMGAAGRDFHNFNVIYRDNPDYNVVAFTATQIPNIFGRSYPAQLAGKLYPKGIKIYDEKELTALIKKLKVDEVVFAERGDLQPLGARALEGLNLQVDSRRKRLVAAGPIISAAAVPPRFGHFVQVPPEIPKTPRRARAKGPKKPRRTTSKAG